MTTGFISTRLAYVTSHHAYFDEANGRLIEALLSQDESLVLMCYQVESAQPMLTCQVSPQHITTAPWVGGYGGAWKYRKEIKAALLEMDQRCDRLLIQWPFHAWWLLPKLTKPVVFHLCADVVAAARNPVKYNGLKKYPARLWATMMMRTLRYVTKRNQGRAVTNGELLLDQLHSVFARATVSSSIKPEEVKREDWVLKKWQRQQDAIEAQLLFVGRPSLEKGADILLKALHQLQEKGFAFRAHWVGTTQEELVAHNPHVNISHSLMAVCTFYGEVPFGPQLFAIFDTADLLLLPSRNEGTPRVLLEARARGCVVIGSRVGGIPSSIKNGVNGWLVSPEDAGALAETVTQVWVQKEARKDIMRQGRDFAASHTVNDFALDILNSLKEL